MSENKWEGLAGNGARLMDLGRPAIFLIPANKLDHIWKGTQTIRGLLHHMLSKRWNAYSTSLVPSFGVYTSGSGLQMKDQCVVYEVSFVGKEGIPELTRLLAKIARRIDEECIYLKAGQYACLVYPT